MLFLWYRIKYKITKERRAHMKESENQIDIINRLLPGGILTNTEQYIVNQLALLEEEEKFMMAAYPLTEEAKKALLIDAHPYIRNLLANIPKKSRFKFETFADWYDLKALSYETVSQYLEGKVAHQVLEYNLVRTGKTTEEELKSLSTKKRNLWKVLKNINMPLDTKLPVEEKLEIYHTLNIIEKMNTLNMTNGNSEIETLDAVEGYGSAILLAQWYYKHQASEIYSYMEEVIKPEIDHREETQERKQDNFIFIKTNNS